MQERQAFLQARQALQQAGLAEAEREARLICANLCGLEPGQLPLHWECAVDEVQLNRLLKRRVSGEPLQYVLGEAGFMGLVFQVGPGVLIPRADTEVIVEKAISLLKEAKAPLIADIGTGCGAIALSLAHYLPRAMVFGVDISPAALEWAEKSARAQGLSSRYHFCQGDLLRLFAAINLHFDMIISNPPYITEAEMEQLPPEVREEPISALYGGEDGLYFYRRLAREAGPLLKPGGLLLLEHGWQQQNKVCALLEQAGWQVQERLCDYGGRDRGVLCALPCEQTAP
jgi:release factor glutamine methyltransferase